MNLSVYKSWSLSLPRPSEPPMTLGAEAADFFTSLAQSSNTKFTAVSPEREVL